MRNRGTPVKNSIMKYGMRNTPVDGGDKGA
jgi:hypothetical protein